MGTLRWTAACAAFLLTAAGPSDAGGVHVAPVTDYVEANVRTWIDDPLIVETLKSRNLRHANLSQADIEALDARWRAEFAGGPRPLIDAVMNNRLSAFLKNKQIASGGVVTEILVIDARGLSVGENEISSDYWQGDELKWLKTFRDRSPLLFVDAAEKDESTQTLQSQASLTISDPHTGKPLGAITIGINLDAL